MTLRNYKIYFASYIKHNETADMTLRNYKIYFASHIKHNKTQI
jgi:hypothetical protein